MSIASYLSELVLQKNNLAANLVTKGVSASSSETLNTLVPKVLSISGGSGGGDDGAVRGIVEGTLSTIYDASASFLRSSVFQSFSYLTKASFPACTEIGACAFQTCTNLTEISFPACTKITASAFRNCNNISEAIFPSCTRITYSVFQNCYNLSRISFPECTSVGRYAFDNCTRLTEVSFPACSIMGSSAFNSCYALMSLYLLGSVFCALEANVFKSTPIGGYSMYAMGYGSVYVPASLYSQYIADQNWQSISDRIVSV